MTDVPNLVLFVEKPREGFSPRNPRRLRARRPPRLTVAQILDWACRHHQRTGKWPNGRSGFVYENHKERWSAIDASLSYGHRGLPGGTTLAQLLAEHFGVRHRLRPPPLTIGQILAWADAHHARTGKWPGVTEGAIPEAPGETWGGINAALTRGRRDLPGGRTLPDWLTAERGARKRPPPLTVAQILSWADAHRQATGAWPNADSGPITDADGETWRGVVVALQKGGRGLPTTTLAQLLSARRGLHYRHQRLTVAHILTWADAHYQRTALWPTGESGAILGAPGESWECVDQSLRSGSRGLPGGSSLFRLLSERRGVCDRRFAPPLDVEEILKWADAHCQRTGTWPNLKSGPIPEAADSWIAIDSALKRGGRGLPGGASLASLLAEHRGQRNRKALPPLRKKDILAWARAHRRRTRKWPTANSGPVVEAPGETWRAIEHALFTGGRGLAGGSSLARFLRRKHSGRKSGKKRSDE